MRVVDVLRRTSADLLREGSLAPEQRRLLLAIRACRTPALGGQVLVCPQCGMEKQVFHSCRQRGCPNCQAQAQDEWIAARSEAMLPVPHFHVVFTLPAQLRTLCRAHPKPMYDLLLRTAGDVLLDLGRQRLGVQLGVTVVLHTWTRDLCYHVHAHCIVSAGGWDKVKGVFRSLRHTGYLFPAAQMKAAFQARFLRGLRGLVQQGVVKLPGEIPFARFERSLPEKKRWVVYAQAPFGRFEHVVAYLGRYTHRVGISNSRLRAVTDDKVTFATRDGKTCALSHLEFGRRFLQHALPDGLKKIRHYGLYAPAAADRVTAQAAIAQETRKRCAPEPSTPAAEGDLREPVWREHRCPHCDVLLVLALDIPRPPRRPWRPP